MENLEVSARTAEEAIQSALEQLGATRDEVEVTVVKEGKHGILGLGAEEAIVRVRRLKSAPKVDIADTAKGVLEGLLSRMGVEASVVPQESPPAGEDIETAAPLTFDIKGEDLGILIGRRGQTLSCLQYMVRLMVAHQTKAWLPIIVDVEGYKRRRYQALRALAWRVADQVKARESAFTLKPMPAYERRIIHLTLADHPDVITHSIGEGEARRVVISPKGK